ncbi:drug resistance transporter, EmrB/QacA subfamily [Amycolatopsis arida]|uniref:Drug resistance transporter, EmrB/QacA subfamily n=1 Tax=Amycolatopsis arida TaxID=587909 RepID=A0A1I5Q473_9PSEU|nr:MFS transporter [Amycolatopsis arida]TDX98701.1 EmrB/QacA subfamily drug resistance transporter [Amycolatopsis arida]SFP40666.1 drug resistance transporter, EmrB/QacA subfamily [Amycolatopsis arida]
MTALAPTLADRRAERRRWWGLAAIGMAQLLVLVDVTIMTIALPSAQRDLGMSDATRQWAITGYTLAFGGLLLFGGRLADRLGRRRTLLGGTVGFALASAVAGAAATPETLVAARVGQGVFAALLAPSAVSLLTIMFTEPRERARAFGLFSAIVLSGAALGLVVGGALAEYLGWRWCMYVNLPVALVATVLGAVVLPHAEAHRDTRLDWVSALLGGGGTVALVTGLTQLAERGTEPVGVIGLLGAAVVLLGGFVLRQARVRGALLPLAVLADRARAAAFGTIAIAAFGMFGMLLFLTFQMQAVLGYGPLATGAAFLPFVAVNVLVSTQLTRRLVPRVGPRPLLFTGLLVLAVGLLALTRLSATSSYAGVLLPAMLLVGAGAGLAMPTVMNTATAGVAPRHTGVASAFLTTCQQVGGSLGTAVLNTVAAGATAAVAGAGPTAQPPAAATVHGYAVASGWGAAVLAAGAVAMGLLSGSGARGRDGIRRRRRPAGRAPGG